MYHQRVFLLLFVAADGAVSGWELVVESAYCHYHTSQAAVSHLAFSFHHLLNSILLPLLLSMCKLVDVFWLSQSFDDSEQCIYLTQDWWHCESNRANKQSR